MKVAHLAAALLTGAMLAATPVKADEAGKLVTVLTAPEPQTQLMAMVLTMQSIQQKAKAQILLCGPAGDLALKDAPASATAPQKPKDMSPQGLMKKIIGTGAKVEVCAIYLPNKGASADVLIDGVGVAKPQDMAASLLAEDTRILSF
ncbi:hypothetical protein [Roseibium aggregatum]|uniref:DsrE/DsrF/DsrH-like protein n=1 Tax=Roseibium aggregatum TaxID=187304 RepID=A0A939EJP1_9HYPH|nr:hypothetical protein [Roseibium aggregatum]MBN9673553.1 hypothetical protein [Roseibium aggregatum]